MSKTNYTDIQFENNYPKGVEYFYWSRARDRILHKAIARQQIIGENFLEVGCGTGVVVKHLNSVGIHTVGIELSEVQVIEGLSKELIFTGKDALLMPDAFKKQFTTLLLLDVIEHIESPEDFIDSLLKGYPNIKNIVITVPACQEIWSNYDEFYGHFRRYDLKMTEEIAKKHNLKILENRYLFHSLYPMARLLLNFAQKRDVQIKAPKKYMRFIHKLLALYFIIENFIIPKKWKGTSILFIAKKL